MSKEEIKAIEEAYAKTGTPVVSITVPIDGHRMFYSISEINPTFRGY